MRALDSAVDDTDASPLAVEPELAGPGIVVRGHDHAGEPTRACVCALDPISTSLGWIYVLEAA